MRIEDVALAHAYAPISMHVRYRQSRRRRRACWPRIGYQDRGRQPAGQDKQQAGCRPADRDVGFAVTAGDGDAGRCTCDQPLPGAGQPGVGGVKMQALAVSAQVLRLCAGRVGPTPGRSRPLRKNARLARPQLAAGRDVDLAPKSYNSQQPHRLDNRKRLLACLPGRRPWLCTDAQSSRVRSSGPISRCRASRPRSSRAAHPGPRRQVLQYLRRDLRRPGRDRSEDPAADPIARTVMPRDGYAPHEQSARTGCSSTANGICDRYWASMSAITTATARTSPASNDHPTTTARRARRRTCRYSGGRCSAA